MYLLYKSGGFLLVASDLIFFMSEFIWPLIKAKEFKNEGQLRCGSFSTLAIIWLMEPRKSVSLWDKFSIEESNIFCSLSAALCWLFPWLFGVDIFRIKAANFYIFKMGFDLIFDFQEIKSFVYSLLHSVKKRVIRIRNLKSVVCWLFSSFYESFFEHIVITFGSHNWERGLSPAGSWTKLRLAIGS